MRRGPLAQQNSPMATPPLGGDTIEQPYGDLPLQGDTIQPSDEPPLRGNTNQQLTGDLRRRGDSSRSQDNGLMSGLLPPHLNDGSKRRRIEKQEQQEPMSYWSRHQGHFSIMLQFGTSVPIQHSPSGILFKELHEMPA